MGSVFRCFEKEKKFKIMDVYPVNHERRKERFKENYLMCPICNDPNIRLEFVDDSRGFSTRIQYFPFEDEFGPHLHDYNHYSTIVYCKNNHRFNGGTHICPNPKCDWVQSN